MTLFMDIARFANSLAFFAARDNTFESRPDVISSPVRNAEELCRNA